MFQTDVSWECFGALGAILEQPGLRSYQCVEVAVNGPLFHVDFHLNETLEPTWAWSRFICTKLADVLELLGRNDHSGTQLSIQTPRESGGYRFFSVVQIVKSKTPNADDIFVILGPNGETYIDGPGEADVRQRQVVWTRNGY
jgi:hypothetical protein